MTLGDSHDWEAIAQDYANRQLTVTVICEMHGLRRDQLYSRIRREGWVPRSEAFGAAKRGRKRQPSLSRRFLLALESRLAEYERRLGDTGSAADAERDARTLNILVKLHETLKAPPPRGASPSTRGPADDATALRLDLARRLERLVAAGD